MDWTELLQPWGIKALLLIGALFTVAVIIALLRKKFQVKEVKVGGGLLPFEVNAEPREKDKKETPPKSPSQRITQEVKAKNGGQASDIKQSAPAGTNTKQHVSAQGKNSIAEDIHQNIH